MDLHRIRQVLDNLLTNAAVHTPAGTPVSVEVTQEVVPGQDTAMVRIEDAWPGILPTDREHCGTHLFRAPPLSDSSAFAATGRARWPLRPSGHRSVNVNPAAPRQAGLSAQWQPHSEDR
ncbi:ATP-binding protein [Streptomyces sp. NPDC059262]|uniref:ATP-binding protein n=1 Tax=Streptomyces sp. NPDC059262 TaxID=3346797 RepID=UPI003675FCEF